MSTWMKRRIERSRARCERSAPSARQEVEPRKQEAPRPVERRAENLSPEKQTES